MSPFISIICPIYNEEKHIMKFVDSIIQQDYRKEFLEVLLIDGGSTDNTREIIVQSISDKPYIRLLNNLYKIVPIALNIGIKEARGEVIIRIDAHCVYPSNYFSTLIKYLYKQNADNVGGLWNTLPANDSAKAYAIAIASSHIFGVGNSKYKIGTKEIIETDTVPFGCYKREIFDKIGLFDEELIRNQDDEFNARLINHGGKIFLIPDLIIEYTARATLKKMGQMYYQYGLFKPLVNKKLGRPATIRQFFPVIFFGGLIGGGLLSVFSRYIYFLYVAIGVIYLLIGLTVGFANVKKYRDWKLLFYLPITFFLIHISYGWGYIRGLCKIFTKQKFSAEVTR